MSRRVSTCLTPSSRPKGLKGQKCRACHACVGPPIDRCLSRGRISKTEQDKRIVVIEHYIEDGTVNSVAAFAAMDHPQNPGGYFGFK